MTTRLSSPQTPSLQATSLPMMNSVVSLTDVASRLSALPTFERPFAHPRKSSLTGRVPGRSETTACLVFAVLAVTLFAPGVVRPRSLVRIGPQGLEQCGVRSLFVPWSEITDISITKRELGGAKLKSVCVNVRDPDKLVHGTPRRLLHAGESRWWWPIVKLVFCVFLLVAEGPAGVGDLKDVVKSDVKLRGIVEIPTSAGFPMSADDLAALLRRWQQRYAKAPAAPEQPSLDPWPAG